MFYPIDDCVHPLLCLPDTGIVSLEIAISGSFQQNLASVCNGVSVCRLIMGWIPGYGSLSYWIHHRSPNGGARESTQGAKGVCNPIGGTTI